jgi:hypothetical protein
VVAELRGQHGALAKLLFEVVLEEPRELGVFVFGGA